MRNHTVHHPPGLIPLTGTAAPVAAARPVTRPAITPGQNKLWDKLCAAAVIAVVLATCIMVGAYAAREAGLVREAGSAAALASTAVAPPAPAGGVDRASLIAFSMGIDLLIFVGLGLYLRWDSEREQGKKK